MSQKANSKPTQKAAFSPEQRKARLEEIWPQLTWNQKRYVAIAHQHPDKASAAKALRIKAQTMYRWPEIVDEAAELVVGDLIEIAKSELQGAVLKAAQIKIEGLDSKGKRLAQDAATEILDRTLGKPTQRQDITSKGERVVLYLPEKDPPSK